LAAVHGKKILEVPALRNAIQAHNKKSKILFFALRGCGAQETFRRTTIKIQTKRRCGLSHAFSKQKPSVGEKWAAVETGIEHVMNVLGQQNIPQSESSQLETADGYVSKVERSPYEIKKAAGNRGRNPIRKTFNNVDASQSINESPIHKGANR
jgi:hypothetical protein